MKYLLIVRRGEYVHHLLIRTPWREVLGVSSANELHHIWRAKNGTASDGKKLSTLWSSYAFQYQYHHCPYSRIISQLGLHPSYIRIPIANIDESLHITTLSCVDAFILAIQQTFSAYSQVIWATAPNSTDAQTTVNTISQQTLSQTHGLQKLALIYFKGKQPSTSLPSCHCLLASERSTQSESTRTLHFHL